MAQNKNQNRMRSRDKNDRRQNNRQAQDKLGERFGNNYGFGREGEHVAPQGYSTVNNQESDYVFRYNPPNYRQPMLNEEDRPEQVPHYTEENIYDEVCKRLKRHGQVDTRNIEVKVRRYEVTLKGSVSDWGMKKIAERIAESVPGVIGVHNRLRIQDQKDTSPRYEQGRRIA